jgi:hypothetical protein
MSPGEFRRQFEGGAWLNLPSVDPPGSDDVVSRYRRILYGSLIMPAWISNDKDPVILWVLRGVKLDKLTVS